jgi:glycerophosphoryl diester phosphodiesterase
VIELRPGAPTVRIGHRGASLLAPENTLRSLEAAVAAGVDAVEIDVLDLADGTLVLAHSDDLLEVSHGAGAGTVRGSTLAELRRVAPELPTFDEALAFVAERDVTLQVDVKARGHEERILEALRRRGLAERCFVSSSSRTSLHAFRELEPRLPRSLSFPDDHYGISRRRALDPLVPAALAAMRRLLPLRLGGWLRRVEARAATLHHGVVSPAVIRSCHAHGLPVYAWTVNDVELAKSLLAAGIDGIISDDPRIFSQLPLKT